MTVVVGELLACCSVLISSVSKTLWMSIQAIQSNLSLKAYTKAAGKELVPRDEDARD